MPGPFIFAISTHTSTCYLAALPPLVPPPPGEETSHEYYVFLKHKEPTLVSCRLLQVCTFSESVSLGTDTVLSFSMGFQNYGNLWAILK